MHLIHGTDDDTVPPAHLDLYASAIPQARTHRLPGRDHQLNNDLREVAEALATNRARDDITAASKATARPVPPTGFGREA